jgi:hypothetical protein
MEIRATVDDNVKRSVAAWITVLTFLYPNAARRGCAEVGLSAVQCTTTHVAVDTVGADTSLVCFNSRGWGEVVRTSDTLAVSFTVWRTAFENFVPYKARLFVERVDSTDTPIVGSVLYAGPSVTGAFGDGAHPVPLVFSIEPPLALPGPGKYYFNVSEASCFGNFSLMAVSTNRYAPGGTWQTGAQCDPRAPGTPSGDYRPQLDLIFDASFCSIATPVRRPTWGSLKLLYR